MDARTDAETLLTVAADEPSYAEYGMAEVYGVNYVVNELAHAARPERAAMFARWAASAAFRAVPGLRG